MQKVTVYVTNSCPYCVKAKSLLTKRGVEFEVVDVTNDQAKRDWLVKASGRRTVPQIFIGDESVGGSDDIYALDAAGKLMPKVLA